MQFWMQCYECLGLIHASFVINTYLEIENLHVGEVGNERMRGAVGFRSDGGHIIHLSVQLSFKEIFFIKLKPHHFNNQMLIRF